MAQLGSCAWAWAADSWAWAVATGCHSPATVPDREMTLDTAGAVTGRAATALYSPTTSWSCSSVCPSR